MTDHVTALPDLPRPVPNLTCGATVTGSEVIDCRLLVQSDPAPDARLAADGAWEIGVPESTVPLTDFLAPEEDPRILDDGWRTAGATLLRRLTALVEAHPVKAKRHLVQIRVPESTTRRHLRNLAQGLAAAGSPVTLSRKDSGPVVRDIRVDLTDVAPEIAAAADRELRLGGILGAATALARDLDAVPDGARTADWWRTTARSMVGGLPGLRVKVRGPGWLERKGFQALRSVSADPLESAALVEIIWDPAAADGDLTDERPDTVLVGGGAVAATVRALAQLRSPRKVLGLVPVTGVLRAPHPPLPGRPDEIIEHLGGLTTQLNIAGEEAHRLQLAARLATADTVAHAARRYRPRRIVTVGPTTVAAKVALGTRTGALFCPDDTLARRITLRGAKVGERWWPMPLVADLQSAVSSEAADLTGEPTGPAALAAALYLDRFSGDIPLIHLDTAGPAVADAPTPDTGRGPTGFAARSLVEWLRK
ncbi:M17 family metallopeptidase [Corynebacterium terpenotabidum]|uniref:Probable cytosol aminopeptidase n=1 Tax=Corynebacterium terpenotabidum Y-11 TaxID=1200352 RepID=S4XF14_9CORY|nr:aminopeptidase [Corynebacterium terpenotabidum]AGP31164.1 putative aminopeptidase [Corynebacterium terpenotabidum Y-11]